jgi:predicted MFS family arabinose efflux permease
VSDTAGDPTSGWAIVGGLAVTQTVGYGVLYYSFGVLLVPMQPDLGWSRVALNGAFSTAILFSGLAGVYVGRLLDQRSPRLPMTAGSVAAGLLVFAWSRVSSLLELYLVFAGLGLAMAFVLYEAAFVVITGWFRARRTTALATLTTIAASSSFIFSPLADWLSRTYGWRTAVAVLALVIVATTVPLHGLLLRTPPRQSRLATIGSPRARVNGRLGASGGALWLLVAAFAANSFAVIAVVVSLVPLLRDSGFGPADAALAVALLGLAQVAGRVAVGLTSEAMGAQGSAGTVLALSAAALTLLALSRSTWAVDLFALVFGASSGALILLRATLIADLYGVGSYGATAGVVSAFALGARAAAPLGAAVIALAPGGYRTLLLVLAALSSLAAPAAVSACQKLARSRSALGCG